MKTFYPRLWSTFCWVEQPWSSISWLSVPAFSSLLYNGYLLLSRLSPIGCHHQNLHQHQHCDQNPPPPHCNYDQNHFDKMTIIAIVIQNDHPHYNCNMSISSTAAVTRWCCPLPSSHSSELSPSEQINIIISPICYYRLVVLVTIFTILILDFSGCCCFVAVLPMFHHEPCFAQNSNWPIRSQRGSSKRELPTLDEDRIDEKSCFANNYQHIGCYYYVEGDVALLQYIDVLHNVTQANENLGEEIFLRRWCHVQLMVKMMLVLVSTWWGALAKIGQLFWPGFVEIGLDGCFPKGNGRPWFAENLDHFSSIFFPITITNLALSPTSEGTVLQTKATQVSRFYFWSF